MKVFSIVFLLLVILGVAFACAPLTPGLSDPPKDATTAAPATAEPGKATEAPTTTDEPTTTPLPTTTNEPTTTRAPTTPVKL